MRCSLAPLPGPEWRLLSRSGALSCEFTHTMNLTLQMEGLQPMCLHLGQVLQGSEVARFPGTRRKTGGTGHSTRVRTTGYHRICFQIFGELMLEKATGFLLSYHFRTQNEDQEAVTPGKKFSEWILCPLLCCM